MNDPRDKPPHSKLVNVKSKTRETQYLKYRSFKPKCVESRVAGYINTKKSRVDNAGTAAISASARFQQQQQQQQQHHHHHQHQLNQNAKTSRSHGAKTGSNSGAHLQVEVPSIESKKSAAKRPARKEHRVMHNTNHSGNGKPRVDGEEKDGHKTNIQTEVHKTHPQPKSKQRHHQHKKYKTFDIASFPRVFSTSDLMEKMSEEPNSSHDPRDKCEFHNIDLRAAPTAQPQPPPSHTEDEAQQLEFRNEDVNIDITCHRSQLVDTPAFPHVNSMVFQCEQPVVDLSSSDSYANDSRSQNYTAPSEPKSDERLSAKSMARENDILKTNMSEQQIRIDELHKCVHRLQDELGAKGDVEEELQRSKNHLQKQQSEMNAIIDQNTKLKEELEKNAALIEVLSKCNEKLASVEEDPSTTTASVNEEMVASLRGECDSLRVTNAELVNDLRKYQTTIGRLEAKVGEQEKAVRMLEDEKMASANQLNVYETEIVFLNDAKGKLLLENQQLEARNKRLLNVLALNHVLALSKQLPYTSGRNVTAPTFDATSNTSQRRNRLQEIKHFNTSCQKFTSTQ